MTNRGPTRKRTQPTPRGLATPATAAGYLTGAFGDWSLRASMPDGYLGECLSACLNARHMTWDQLAEDTTISRERIAQIFRGQAPITVEEFDLILRVLGLTIQVALLPDPEEVGLGDGPSTIEELGRGSEP